jgi:hypothetical protein
MFKESLQDDDEGIVGSWNCTFHLMNPLMLVTMFFLIESCVPFVVSFNPNLCIQTLNLKECWHL